MTQVRDLAAAPYNPRYMSAKRGEALKKAMHKFGDLSDITYNRRTGHLVGGHQRIKYLAPNAKIKKAAAKDDAGTVALGVIISGRSSWSYREVDWDQATEKAANIAANAAGGAFDEDKLAGIVFELDKVGFEMELLNLESLEQILQKAAQAPPPVDQIPQHTGKARAKRGDLYELGAHRLMCGDATNQNDVARLMGHQEADLVFTDPPYGVTYQAKGGDFAVIEGDRKRDDDLHSLISLALKQAVRFTKATAAFYIWHASSTRREFEDAIRDAGLVERQYLIWVKNSIVVGYSDYRWAHEPCFYASRQGTKPAWYGDKAQPTVWRATLQTREAMATTLAQALLLTDGDGGQILLSPRLAKGKKVRTARMQKGQTIRVETSSNSATVFEVGRDSDYVHPTQKPVELARIALTNSNRRGDVVLDLFGGSGTTLIAAEMLERKSCLMELDPHYVDAIITRWQDLTKQKAKKL